MIPTRMMAAIAAVGLLSPAAMAAVRPSVATSLAAPASFAPGARVGAAVRHRSHISQDAALALGVGGLAAAGVGAAGAAGAFNGHNHDNSSVSP